MEVARRPHCLAGTSVTSCRTPMSPMIFPAPHSTAIGTLVERSSRSTILVYLPRIEGWGEKPPVKNGPALGGYGAVAMNAALIASMTQLPGQLRKTLTWDRGKELSSHAQFALDTGTRVFFADPHSPWQRPTKENTNGLLRQYFP